MNDITQVHHCWKVLEALNAERTRICRKGSKWIHAFQPNPEKLPEYWVVAMLDFWCDGDQQEAEAMYQLCRKYLKLQRQYIALYPVTTDA
jgi:hypothetical protein